MSGPTKIVRTGRPVCQGRTRPFMQACKFYATHQDGDGFYCKLHVPSWQAEAKERVELRKRLAEARVIALDLLVLLAESKDGLGGITAQECLRLGREFRDCRNQLSALRAKFLERRAKISMVIP